MLEDKILNVFKGNNGLFKDRNVFDMYYVPKQFLFRDSQMKALANNIKPAFHGGGPIHTVILGDHATGKTTAIKKIFQIAQQYKNNVIPVYINCKIHNTKFKVYSAIFKKVFNIEPLKRGTSATLLFDKIMKQLKKQNQILIIALDDINYLLNNKKGQELFHELIRAYEIFNVKIGIYPLLTSLEFRYNFDKNINSLFIPQEILFPHYTEDEIYTILKKRADLGFQKRVINHEILLKVSKFTKKHNNLRLGLHLLQNLCMIAANEGNTCITNQHFNQLIKTKK